MPCPRAPDDRESGAFGDFLDGMGHVGEAVALPALLDGRIERRLARLQQPLRLVANLAHGERVRRVGDEALERDADVRRQDVALLQRVVAGDAVDDHVVRG